MEQQVYIKLAEYVGGGDPVEISQDLVALVTKYGAFRKYPHLYRIWLFINTDRALKQIYQGQSFPVQETHACTRSRQAIKDMYEEEGYEGYPVIITKYTDVIGFDPIEILRNGIDLAGNETSFVKRVIAMHDYQKEVYVLKAITEIYKEDIYKILK